MKILLRTKQNLKKVKQEFLNYKLQDILDSKNVKLEDIKGITLDLKNRRLVLALTNKKHVSLPKLNTEAEALKLNRRLRAINKINDLFLLFDEC